MWIAWRWRHCVSLKHCYLCAILRHIAVIQNATIWILTAMKTSVLMVCILQLVFVDLCIMQSWSLLNVSKLAVRLNMQVTLRRGLRLFTVVARCSFVESSDVSRNPLYLFHSTLTVPSLQSRLICTIGSFQLQIVGLTIMTEILCRVLRCLQRTSGSAKK